MGAGHLRGASVKSVHNLGSEEGTSPRRERQIGAQLADVGYGLTPGRYIAPKNSGGYVDP